MSYLHTIKPLVHRAKTNVLFANSINLMLASGITAAFGFIFWVIVAHSFRTETVGLATALLSVASLLSLLGLAGFDTVFIRFLAKSKSRNEHINSGLIIAGVASAFIAGLFCLLVPLLSSKLTFVSHNPAYVAAFILVTVFMTWNTLTNAILIAYRRTSFVLVIDLIFSVLKISLPFIVRSGGPMTIFVIVGISQLVNVLLSVAVLMKYFEYMPSFKINFGIVREKLRYSSTMYAANTLNLLPDTALPLIVLNNLGAAAAAYFYIAFSIANLLYTIAFSTSQVLLAEVSHDEEHFAQHLRKGLLIVSGLLIPAVVLMVVFCPFILNFFGHSYRGGATDILRLLSVSGLAVMFYSLLSTVFKQTKNLKAMLVMTSTNAFVIIGLSVVLVKSYGLIGIGWAWLIGTVIATAFGYIALAVKKREVPSMPAKIIISHVYSEHNKGDAALLSVLIGDVHKEFNNPLITVLTLDSVSSNKMFEGAKVKNSFMFYAMNRFDNDFLTLLYAVYVITITMLWAFVRRLTGLSLPIGHKLTNLCLLYEDTDLILPVGGGYLRGQKKGIGSLLNVTLLLHPLWISNLLGKPTVLYSQSIGPFSSKLEERMVGFSLNRCTEAIIVREDTSLKLLRRLGVKDNVYRSVDSGFAFDAGDVKYDLREKLKIKSNKQLLFGITARKWLPEPAQSNYERAIAESIEHIISKYDASVVFIPQVTSEFHSDDDRLVHKRIFDYISNHEHVYLVDGELDHYQIKSAYDSLDFVIGTRFHSVIFSLTSYVPAIAIEYEHKTSGIMHDLGLDKWVMKMEAVNSKDLCAKVDELITGSEAYKNKLKQIMPTYIKKTDEPIKVVSEAYKKLSKELADISAAAINTDNVSPQVFAVDQGL